MITALFAIGNKGEFANKGKLPWNDYKLELETFYATLDVLKPVVILMGAETYKNLPAKVIDRILHASNLESNKDGEAVPSALHVVGTSAIQDTIDKRKDLNFVPILTLGENFKDFYPRDASIVCIGGAKLIDSLLELDALDSMYISIVTPTNPSETMGADTYISKKVLELKATKLFQSSTFKEGENYMHTQEIWVL